MLHITMDLSGTLPIRDNQYKQIAVVRISQTLHAVIDRNMKLRTHLRVVAPNHVRSDFASIAIAIWWYPKLWSHDAGLALIWIAVGDTLF